MTLVIASKDNVFVVGIVTTTVTVLTGRVLAAPPSSRCRTTAKDVISAVVVTVDSKDSDVVNVYVPDVTTAS